MGDKLIPALLEHVGEQIGPAIDNLNKAEQFGWIDSAEQWLLYRRLRNQMIHEYIEDNQILTNALKSRQSFVPTMLETATTLIQETESRLT